MSIPQQNNNLSIFGKGKVRLTPNQSAFNRLSAKIEKLRKSLTAQQSQLDQALVIYGQEFYPLRKMLQAKQRKLISIFWNYYNAGKINHKNLVHLRHILKAQVDNFFEHSEVQPDEELKEIFAELEGEDYDDVIRRSQENARKDFIESLRKMDIDADMDGVDMQDAAAVAAKMAEIKEKLRQKEYMQREEQERRQGKSQTDSLADNTSAQNGIQQKSLSTLYKQLAKIFHPDLEQDEHLRVEKAALMQELTAAYESKNLHAMLTLELKWIHKENGHLEKLSEEKLVVYLQLLKQQEASLANEKRMLFAAPQYSVLVEEFGHAISRMPVQYLQLQMENLADYKNGLSDTIFKLESPDGQRHLGALIKEWKEEQQRLSYEDNI